MTDHTTEDLKGRLKEAAGVVTGDKGLEREGKVDQASAATKKTVESATERIRQIVNPKS